MITKRFAINEIPDDVRYVVYRQDENNYYDDSDFYWMIHDRIDGKIIKHVYGTTRCGGCSEFPHKVHMLVEGFTANYEYEKNVVEPLAIKQVDEYLGSQDIEIGDIVKVTNKRVRNFKDETFLVESKRDFKLRYGMVASTTLFGENVLSEPIKTAESNVTVIRHNDSKVKRTANRLVVGLSIR